MWAFAKRRPEMQSYAYRQWSKAVKLRDNRTCQRCGKKGGYMEAHHVKSFAGNPGARLAVSNGITLCKTCHRAVTKNARQHKR